jgi:hypothetical protein
MAPLDHRATMISAPDRPLPSFAGGAPVCVDKVTAFEERPGQPSAHLPTRLHMDLC